MHNHFTFSSRADYFKSIALPAAQLAPSPNPPAPAPAPTPRGACSSHLLLHLLLLRMLHRGVCDGPSINYSKSSISEQCILLQSSCTLHQTLRRVCDQGKAARVLHVLNLSRSVNPASWPQTAFPVTHAFCEFKRATIDSRPGQAHLCLPSTS